MTLLFAMPGSAEWIFILIIILFLFVPKIFYLVTLQSTLEAISPENRKMTPVNVWLLLIPLFSIYWDFVIVNKLSDSIQAESNSKYFTLYETKPGYSLGLSMCILNCFFFIPGLNALTGTASFICWILYWIKINEYKKQIKNSIIHEIGSGY